MEALKERMSALTNKKTLLEKRVKEFKISLAQKEKELDKAVEDKNIEESSIEVMKEVIDKLSQEHIRKVRDLLTYAVQTIFYDKNYSVDISIEEKRGGRVINFYLIEQKGEEVIKSDFDSIGGGVLAVVGFVLQVFYIGYFKQSKILFCDESFSNVSEQYVPSLMEFINSLAEKKGFIFVLISHDERWIENAMKTYFVMNGVVEVID